MRLDKFLADLGKGTRKEVKECIRKGLVRVNDKIVKSGDFKVDENNDIIYMNNEKLEYEKFVYLMLNKPAGVISATLIIEIKQFLI